MKQHVTLNDVAARAGVSRAMVSYVLCSGEKGSSRPETRERIYAAVRELGYRKNHTACSLRSGDTRTIGLVLPSQNGGYLYELMTALDRSFRQLDYTLVCSFFRVRGGQNYLPSFSDAMERIFNMNVNAVITPTMRQIPDSSTPVVIWGNFSEKYDCVFPDKKAFGTEVIERLWKLGHRRIAAAGLLHDTRYETMRAALEKRGAFRPEYFAEYSGFQEYGANAVRYFLSLPERPTAIVFHSDEMAIGALRELHLAGVKVPEQISVVGFDHLPVSSAIVPSLATFDQHFDRMAGLLTEITLNRIRQPELPLQRCAVPVGFVSGESLAAPPLPEQTARTKADGKNCMKREKSLRTGLVI